jgi:hypothetical protein
VEASELQGVLTAHAFLRVERPPTLWAPEAELEPFIRLLGEMISAGHVRNGQELAAITLNVANVTVEPEHASTVPAGDFVAVTIRCVGDWAPEATWQPTAPPAAPFVSSDLPAAAAAAGAAYAYTRTLADGEGSVTVFLPRALPGGERSG